MKILVIRTGLQIQKITENTETGSYDSSIKPPKTNLMVEASTPTNDNFQSDVNRPERDKAFNANCLAPPVHSRLQRVTTDLIDG